MIEQFISFLIGPLLNMICLFYYHKEKIIESIEKEKINKLIGILFAFCIATIIHIISIFKKNKYSLKIILFIWTIYILLYSIFIGENSEYYDDKKNLNIYYPSFKSIYQKNINSSLEIDSMFIFKIIYLLSLLILIFISKENSTTNVSILIISCLLFQLINSLIIYLFNTKINIIPSVFMYLNELIENGPTKFKKQENINKVFGYIKLSILIIISIISGLLISKNKINTFKMLSIIGIFTFIVFLWIFIIGDKSIIQRLYNKYNSKSYPHYHQILKESVPIYIKSQLGINLNLLALLATQII